MTLRRPTSTTQMAAQAISLMEAGKLKQAGVLLKAVLKAEPDHFDCLMASAVLHGMNQQYPQAVQFLTRALRSDPDFVPALLNLGTAELMLNHPAEAEAAFARAAAREPANADAHELLGQSRQAQGKLVEAIASYTRAATLERGNISALTSAIALKQKTCDWDGMPALEQTLVATVNTGGPSGQTFEPLVLAHISDDPVLHRRNAEAHWRKLTAQTSIDARQKKRIQHKPRNRPRIRIGYLSADFHQHATAFLMAELFELHDRKRFEVFGFSYGPDDGSAIRQRLVKAFDRFIDVRNTTDEQFAARITACEIDILVDLKGYTQDARLAVLAQRPAPVQCHFIGFPGTLGSDAIDYLITDPIVTPPGSDPHYTECLVRLPDCYQVNDRKRLVAASSPSRSECGLPDDAFVFCSFNGQQKLSLEFFEIWTRILAAVPHAVLWLYNDVPIAADNLRREATVRGIDPARIVIAGKLPPAEHLARLRLADLFLDSRPYGAHTTGSDALWVGVPVLTCPGQAFAGRVGASLLTAIGLPELVASDLVDYEAKAIALARAPDQLAALKQRLIANRDTAALFDTDRFRGNIEAAYAQMWARWQQGLPPAPIDI